MAPGLSGPRSGSTVAPPRRVGAASAAQRNSPTSALGPAAAAPRPNGSSRSVGEPGSDGREQRRRLRAEVPAQVEHDGPGVPGYWRWALPAGHSDAAAERFKVVRVIGRPSVRGAKQSRLQSRRHPPSPRSPSSRARLAHALSRQVSERRGCREGLEAVTTDKLRDPGVVSSNKGSVRAGGECRVRHCSIPAHWRRLVGERRRRTPPSELAGISLVMTQLPCPFGRW